MKIKLTQLRRIIKEEARRVLAEATGSFKAYIWSTDEDRQFKLLGKNYPTREAAIKARNAAFTEQLADNGEDFDDFLADMGLKGDEDVLEDGHLEFWIKDLAPAPVEFYKNPTPEYAAMKWIADTVGKGSSAEVEVADGRYTAQGLKKLGFVMGKHVEKPRSALVGTFNGEPAVALQVMGRWYDLYK